MLRNLPLVLLSLALSGCDLGLSLEGKNGCDTDSDCLGSRVCEARECVDHASSKGGTNAPADGGANTGGEVEKDGGHGGDTGEGNPSGGSNPNNDGSNPSNGDANNGGDAGVPECLEDEDCAHGTCESGTCATVVPHIVTSDVTWRAEDSPYWLSGDVQAGGTLTIESGTTVIGNGHHLQIFHMLAVQGASDQRVELRDVHIEPMKYGRVDIRFARFSGGSVFGEDSESGASLRLRDSILDGAGRIFLRWQPSDTSVLARNIFTGTSDQVVLAGAASATVVENNYFDNVPPGVGEPITMGRIRVEGGEAGLPLPLIARNSFTGPQVVSVSVIFGGKAEAADNYWGTTSPTAIERMIWDRNDDLKATEIPYSPILAKADPLTPTPDSKWPVVDELDPCLAAGCSCDRISNPCYMDLTCVAGTCKKGDYFACDKVVTDKSCTQYVGSDVANDSNLDQVCNGERTTTCSAANVAGHCAVYEGQGGEVVTTYYAGASFTQTDCESAGGRWY